MPPKRWYWCAVCDRLAIEWEVIPCCGRPECVRQLAGKTPEKNEPQGTKGVPQLGVLLRNAGGGKRVMRGKVDTNESGSSFDDVIRASEDQ